MGKIKGYIKVKYPNGKKQEFGVHYMAKPYMRKISRTLGGKLIAYRKVGSKKWNIP